MHASRLELASTISASKGLLQHSPTHRPERLDGHQLRGFSSSAQACVRDRSSRIRPVFLRQRKPSLRPASRGRSDMRFPGDPQAFRPVRASPPGPFRLRSAPRVLPRPLSSTVISKLSDSPDDLCSVTVVATLRTATVVALAPRMLRHVGQALLNDVINREFGLLRCFAERGPRYVGCKTMKGFRVHQLANQVTQPSFPTLARRALTRT